MNDLSRSVNLDYQSLRNSEANQPGVHRTMSLFVNTGEQDRKLFVCCRSDDTIRNLCQAIANIYYETFLGTDKGDKAPNDDYYYDKVNNNVVTVDHLSLNGFTLPFQHKVGDLLENRSIITASITTSKKSKKIKSVKVEEDSQVKRRVGRPKKTPVESETPSVTKDDKKSKTIRVKREEDESLQKDVEREEEIKKKLKTETGAAKSRQASKQEKELMDIIENIDEKAKKGVNEKDILKKQGKASKEEVPQMKKPPSRKETGTSEAGIAAEGKKTPVVVQPEGKKTPAEGKRTPVEGKKTPVNGVKQDTLKMMIEELEDDDLKIVPKKKPPPVVEKVEKQEPKGKPKKIFQGSSDESEEEERIKTPAMDSSRRVSRRGTKDQMVLEDMINKSEEKAKKNTLAAPLIPRKKSSIFVGDSDEEDKPVAKQQQAPTKQVNGKKEAIFLDSSDEETPLKAAPKKPDEGFQKFQKKNEDIIAPLIIPEKTIEKVPTEPNSATSKKQDKGKPKENGPQASRKASESETKKNKEMEEEKEAEALFNETYKKKPAPEDVENGPTQFLPTMEQEEDPLKVPVLSIHHFEPKGKPLPKKKVPSGNESDSGAKVGPAEAESESVKQGKSTSKQNGKHVETKKAEKAEKVEKTEKEKPKEEKETNKGKAKSAQKPPLKLRKASIDLSKSSGSNLVSPTEAVNLHEGLQQGLAKLSKKPATTGKSESKPMSQSQKKSENTKKNEKAKLEDTSETSSDSELELYKKKPVTKNVNLFL